MPSHSRSRDRYGRDPERHRRPHPRARRQTDDSEDNEDFDNSPRNRRYKYDGYRRARTNSPPYESHDNDDGDLNNEIVDVYTRRPERRRREQSTPKKSPTVSPRKSGGTRERDSRRRRMTGDEDASPVPRAGRSRPRDRGQGAAEEVEAAAARRHRRRKREQEWEQEDATTSKHQSTDSTNSAAHLLSADALAKLRDHYAEEDRREKSRAKDAAKADRKQRRKRPAIESHARTLDPFPKQVPRGQSKGRIVSGAYLEEGRGPEMKVRHRGGGGGEPPEDTRWGKEKEDPDANPPFWKQKKWRWVAVGLIILLLIIIIPVAVVVSKKDKDGSKSDDLGGNSGSSGGASNSNLDGLDRNSVPKSAQGTVLDPWTWYDTTDFNVTYTDQTVGGLSIMGLDSTWDDSAQANENVPPLNKPFPYGSQPIRGVNLGGWLSLEPFISPSLFKGYDPSEVIDEWTLCEKLGSSAASTLEKHYATFITEQDFADIRDAGLDHVRIQFSYWAVTPIDGEPFVPRIAWRYLLRAIEYCRKYGLRVNLDPHGIPGSQNGWNHSGRQGEIRWLQGTDGSLNRKRSLEFHNKLSKFFAQDRYHNIIGIYGLVNEPFMLSLPVADVLEWTTEAAELVQSNGITAYVAFHDGFLNLSKWKQMLKGGPAGLLLDTHQYTIFNTGQIVLNHDDKVSLVCDDWFSMIGEINSTSSGWGPTICGEWSQADTDCAQFLNNVGAGTRWEGTLSTSDSTLYCPTADDRTCSCADANADVSDYSDDYKVFLQTYAEAQMSAFGTGMGWFYWTWVTESAPQWSYKTAWKNGFMPSKAYAPDFKCGDTAPGFGTLPEYY